jgi:hypothetical protein
VSAFVDYLPALRRAHDATRPVIRTTGCRLAAALLTLDLGRAGEPAEYVHGHYLQPDKTEHGGVEHWWVEVGAVLLDPTRDQFGENPFCETYEGRYVSTDRMPASGMKSEIYSLLRPHWGYKKTEDAIRGVVEQYRLDLSELDNA